MFARTALLAFALAVTAAQADEKATSFSADITGLWYVPSESGWGANIIQQSQTLFVTLFVYGTDGRPTWLVASAVEFQSSAGGTFVFTGPLYQTTGPYFGGAFNPGAVGVTQVGSLTLRFPDYSQAQLTYTAGGVTVNKTLVPQTWRNNNLSGAYLGGVYGNTASCALPIPQSAAALIGMDVVHAGAGASFRFTGPSGSSCTFTGTVTAFGKLLNVDGNYTCTTGGFGQFAMRRLEAGIDGISGAIVSLSNTSCSAAVLTLGGARVSF